MASGRDLRRLAFQALYQIDARGGQPEHLADVRLSLDQWEGFTPQERDAAYAEALEAWNARAGADAAMEALAPAWPARRQAAVDRAILRLAHYQMHRPGALPKVIVNDAVELAKQFSTDRSPAFVNGLLDKVLKKVLGAAEPPRSEG